MADFDPTTIPEITAQRLDAVAADCQQRGQSMFEQALATQSALLTSLAKPADPLMTTTSSRVESLAATPPPKTKATTNDGDQDQDQDQDQASDATGDPDHEGEPSGTDDGTEEG